MASHQIEKLQQYMRENTIDVCYIDNPEMVDYFTHFESHPHERVVALVVLSQETFLFVPSLEESEAQANSIVEEVVTYKDDQNPWVIIRREVKARIDQVNTLGIEENTLTVDRYNQLKELEDNFSFTDLTAFFQELRLRKTTDEIERMKKAGEYADRAIEIGCRTLKVGITEQEVVAEIEYELKKMGISEMSFSTMVLFGDHAGSPHGTPGDRKLKEGELVLFDLGVVYEGYTSDITRTVAFGEVSEREKQVYDVVLKAQLAAQEAVKPGITASELDRIARTVIEEAGYGNYFTHRLGHGLGKSVHEFPSIAQGNDLKLNKGTCFSIEPGIYIPNQVGVRIEDCVVVTEEGCLAFTSTPKALLTLQVKE